MYIARQPIFDKNMNVYGYELLYRVQEGSSAYEGYSSDGTTATVLGGLFELGLDQIVGNKKAFINFDNEFLLSDGILLIEPDTLVIEVLEHVRVDAALIERILYLKEKGYAIALDDFEELYQEYPLIPSADIIKYDLLRTPLKTLGKEVRYALNEGKVLLAEKIETDEEFQIAKDMGFSLFQGYFFSKPKVIAGIRAKKSANQVYHQLIRELKKEEPSYELLADIIGTDVNLAYRLMKATSTGTKARTLKNALVKMGFQELERWVSVLMLQELSGDKPQELVRMSLIRSRFGELIAAHSSFARRKHEISLMCLFSVLDALLDQPMAEALEGIEVSDDIRDLLVHQRGDLRPIYDIITCYEGGNCILLSQYSYHLQLDDSKLFGWYLHSIRWSEEILKTVL